MFAEQSPDIVRLNLAVVGLGVSAIGSWTLLRSRRVMRHRKTAQGVIVDVRFRWGRRMYPVFRFQAEDGCAYTVKSWIGLSPSPFRIGDEVYVFYNPSKPDEAVIDSVLLLRTIPYGLMIVGGMMLAGAAWWYVQAWRSGASF